MNQVRCAPITQLFTGTTDIYRQSHISLPGREDKLVSVKDEDVQRPSYPVVFGMFTKYKIIFNRLSMKEAGVVFQFTFVLPDRCVISSYL